jgi:biotin transport system substrate-specific component
MRTKNIILVALFAALTASGAFIRIPIGPVPITLQFFFTALSGILLGPYLGALSQLIYILLGLTGIPVFTAGGGLSYIFNPGFGYLIGFLIAPLLIGKIFESTKKPSFPRTLLACLLGLLVIYAVGVPYMYMILRNVTHTNITFLNTLVIGFLVFLPGDTAKSIAAAYFGVRIAPVIKKSIKQGDKTYG